MMIMNANKMPHKIVDDRKQKSAANCRQDNGNFRRFVVVKDPLGLYTPGVSVFGSEEMKFNLRNDVFAEGTMFLIDGHLSATVVNGKLMCGTEPLRIG